MTSLTAKLPTDTLPDHFTKPTRRAMRRILGAALLTAALAPSTAAAQTVTFRIYGNLPHRARVKRALVEQATLFRWFWPDTPAVAFGTHGLPIVLMGDNRVAKACHGGAACHTRHHRIYVSDDILTTMAMSHEMLETLADPGGNNGVEVCDPVADYSYWRRGTRLSDFTTQAYWYPGLVNGRRDYLNTMTGG